MKKLLILLIFISNYSILLKSASSRVMLKAARRKAALPVQVSSSGASKSSLPSVFAKASPDTSSSSSSAFAKTSADKSSKSSSISSSSSMPSSPSSKEGASLKIKSPYEKYKEKCEARKTKETESLESHLPTVLGKIITEYSVDCVSPEQFKINGEALIKATEENNVKRVEELLKSGAVNVDARIVEPVELKEDQVEFEVEETTWTPLTMASFLGNKNIVELLLKHGADVNAKSKWLRTPLMEASAIGRIEIVDLLLKNNAEVNLEDNGGNTALSFAVGSLITTGYDHVKMLNIIKLLLNNNAFVTKIVIDETNRLNEENRKKLMKLFENYR